MRYFLNILVLFVTLFPSLVFTQEKAQDPGWQWGRLSHVENSFRNVGIRTNFYNEIFTLECYIDSIYIEDTAFVHSGGYPNYQDFNLALIKRNSKGEFIKAVDFHTPQNNMIYYPDMEIDHESNIYLYGTYEDTLYVNDTFLLPHSIPILDDIFLIKMDKDLNFKWARTISSPSQDACTGIAVSDDDDIYLSCYHMPGSYDTVHSYINFFDQDSTEILTGVISLLKSDPDGNLLWRREIRKPRNGTGFMRNILVGEDGNIYIEGNVQDDCDLYFPGDTLEFPDDPDYANDSFIAFYNPEGEYLNAFFYAVPDMIVMSDNFYVDDQSNYYINAIIVNSMVFGSDTLELAENEEDYLIAKMDTAFFPIWYERVRYIGGGGEPVTLEYRDQKLAFAFHGTGHFTFMDSAYAYNSNGQVLSGLFNTEGSLEEFQITESSWGTRVNNIYFDNCRNLIFDGSLQGTAHFGDDTINAGYGFHRFLAKNDRVPISVLEMPVDTSGCESVTLFAPEGYLYYQWNDELSDQNWFIVNTSGDVNLKAAHEDGCWSEGETAVTIYPAVEFFLGPDRTILLTDTLKLTAPGGYEHYLWSTGDTVPNLVIPATQLQIGDNIIWLDIENGLCSAADTILVKVIDNSFIQEPDHDDFVLYPNPATSYFRTISLSGMGPDNVILCRCDGQEVMQIVPVNNWIEVTGLVRGVYIVELRFREFTVSKKLIIL